MTAPEIEVFEAPIEEDRLIAISNSHLSEGHCACGAVALVAPGRRPRCGVCLRADADAGSGIAPPPVAGLVPLGQGFPPAPPAGRAPYPAPEVTSRDEWDGGGAPSAFLKNVEKARAAGWRVKVQRSRGCPPNAATGAPSAVRDLFALRATIGTHSAYAVHDGKGWCSVMIWGADLTWFPNGSISDLLEFVGLGGNVPAGWFDAIRERIAAQEERAEELKQCNVGKHPMKFRSQTGDTMSCSRCSNSWPARGEPWRKPKAKKDSAN